MHQLPSGNSAVKRRPNANGAGKQAGADVFAVVAYGQILPREIPFAPTKLGINVFGLDLPGHQERPDSVFITAKQKPHQIRC